MEPEYRIPPRILLGSFALILLVYLGVLLSQGLCFYLTATLFFPEINLFKPPKQTEGGSVLAELEASIPLAFYWIALGLTALCCLGLGAFIKRQSRFAPQGHTVLAAVLIAVTYLQTAFGTPADLKWIALVSMVLFPLAIVAGGQLVAPRANGQAEAVGDSVSEDE